MSNSMSVFAYDSSLQMAFSDNPVSMPKEQEEAKARSSHSNVITIDEWQTYYARFYTEEIPPVIESSPYVVKKIHPGLLEVNFRNFVGLSRIGNLKLEIRNRKISAELYQSTLDELASHYENLVFSFGTPVGQHFNKSTAGKDSIFVEYLFLKKYLLDQSPDIESLGNILAYDPHRCLINELQACSIDECEYVGERILNHLLCSPMTKISSDHPLRQSSLGNALYNTTGENIFPLRGMRELKSFSLDTNENRFVKFFLEELLGKIEKLESALCFEKSSYFNPDLSQNLSILSKKISRVLDHNMWREVGKMRYVPANSQVLQRKEGYRQLFRLFSLLQLATSCDFLNTDFKNLIEIKDLPTLYEYWCFFQAKAVMDSLATAQGVHKIINESAVDYQITYGLCLEYDNGAKLLFNKTLYGSSGHFDLIDASGTYNPTGDSYSHNYRPDIMIELGARRLILDAKYKGKNSGFYGEENDGSIQACKDEDLDKMHCYHDAIDGAKGCYILFPGTKSLVFPRFNSTSCFNGIGAIALRPSMDTNMPKILKPLEYIISDFLQIHSHFT